MNRNSPNKRSDFSMEKFEGSTVPVVNDEVLLNDYRNISYWF